MKTGLFRRLDDTTSASLRIALSGEFDAPVETEFGDLQADAP